MSRYLWVDTDIGGDCDDAGAIALANIASRDGTVKLLGMSFTTSAPAGPACVDAINTFYGNEDVPVGATMRQDFCCQSVNEFQEYVARYYPNRFFRPSTGDFSAAESAVALIRRSLAGVPNGSVTFACIGQLNNVSDLLDSSPDEFSSLDGVELVRRKVNEFVVMGGMFLQPDQEIVFGGEPYKAEYNVATDVASAINFIRKNSVKTVFLDFIVGYKVFSGGPLLRRNDPENPVTAAYRIFQNRPRESWDPLTVWYALYGTGELFKLSESGTVRIESDGRTFFEPDASGNHYYLRLAASNEYCSQAIDQMLLRGECYEKKSEITDRLYIADLGADTSAGM